MCTRQVGETVIAPFVRSSEHNASRFDHAHTGCWNWPAEPERSADTIPS